MTDTTLAGELFLARVHAAEEATDCPHVTFPEVSDVPWLEEGVGMALSALTVAADAGLDYDALANVAAHALWIIAAAGMAAGRALAAGDAFTLAQVDWQNLPDVLGE